MKHLLIAVLLSLSGCATESRFLMQPDQSYLITATRTTLYTPGMNKEAHRKAALLCPNGYTTDTEFQNSSKEDVLIIHCQKLPSVQAINP